MGDLRKKNTTIIFYTLAKKKRENLLHKKVVGTPHCFRSQPQVGRTVAPWPSQQRSSMLQPGSPGPAAAEADTAEAPAPAPPAHVSSSENSETKQQGADQKHEAARPVAAGVSPEGGEAAGGGLQAEEAEGGPTKRRSACDNCSLKKIRVSLHRCLCSWVV